MSSIFVSRLYPFASSSNSTSSNGGATTSGGLGLSNSGSGSSPSSNSNSSSGSSSESMHNDAHGRVMVGAMEDGFRAEASSMRYLNNGVGNGHGSGNGNGYGHGHGSGGPGANGNRMDNASLTSSQKRSTAPFGIDGQSQSQGLSQSQSNAYGSTSRAPNLANGHSHFSGPSNSNLSLYHHNHHIHHTPTTHTPQGLRAPNPRGNQHHPGRNSNFSENSGGLRSTTNTDNVNRSTMNSSAQTQPARNSNTTTNTNTASISMAPPPPAPSATHSSSSSISSINAVQTSSSSTSRGLPPLMSTSSSSSVPTTAMSRPPAMPVPHLSHLSSASSISNSGPGLAFWYLSNSSGLQNATNGGHISSIRTTDNGFLGSNSIDRSANDVTSSNENVAITGGLHGSSTSGNQSQHQIAEEQQARSQRRRNTLDRDTSLWNPFSSTSAIPEPNTTLAPLSTGSNHHNTLSMSTSNASLHSLQSQNQGEHASARERYANTPTEEYRMSWTQENSDSNAGWNFTPYTPYLEVPPPSISDFQPHSSLNSLNPPAFPTPQPYSSHTPSYSHSRAGHGSLSTRQGNGNTHIQTNFPQRRLSTDSSRGLPSPYDFNNDSVPGPDDISSGSDVNTNTGSSGHNNGGTNTNSNSNNHRNNNPDGQSGHSTFLQMHMHMPSWFSSGSNLLRRTFSTSNPSASNPSSSTNNGNHNSTNNHSNNNRNNTSMGAGGFNGSNPPNGFNGPSAINGSDRFDDATPRPMERRTSDLTPPSMSLRPYIDTASSSSRIFGAPPGSIGLFEPPMGPPPPVDNSNSRASASGSSGTSRRESNEPQYNAGWRVALSDPPHQPAPQVPAPPAEPSTFSGSIQLPRPRGLYRPSSPFRMSVDGNSSFDLQRRRESDRQRQLQDMEAEAHMDLDVDMFVQSYQDSMPSSSRLDDLAESSFMVPASPPRYPLPSLPGQNHHSRDSHSAPSNTDEERAGGLAQAQREAQRVRFMMDDALDLFSLPPTPNAALPRFRTSSSSTPTPGLYVGESGLELHVPEPEIMPREQFGTNTSASRREVRRVDAWRDNFSDRLSEADPFSYGSGPGPSTASTGTNNSNISNAHSNVTGTNNARERVEMDTIDMGFGNSERSREFRRHWDSFEEDRDRTRRELNEILSRSNAQPLPQSHSHSNPYSYPRGVNTGNTNNSSSSLGMSGTLRQPPLPPPSSSSTSGFARILRHPSVNTYHPPPLIIPTPPPPVPAPRPSPPLTPVGSSFSNLRHSPTYNPFNRTGPPGYDISTWVPTRYPSPPSPTRLSPLLPQPRTLPTTGAGPSGSGSGPGSRFDRIERGNGTRRIRNRRAPTALSEADGPLSWLDPYHDDDVDGLYNVVALGGLDEELDIGPLGGLGGPSSRRRHRAQPRLSTIRRMISLNRMRALGDYVLDEDFDDSYEALMALTQTIGAAKRGCSSETLAELPSGTYAEFSKTKNGEEKVVGDSQSCAICLEDYKLEDLCLKLSRCSHFYHKECVREWLKTARSCPVCRETVEGAPRAQASNRRTPLLNRRSRRTSNPSRNANNGPSNGGSSGNDRNPRFGPHRRSSSDDQSRLPGIAGLESLGGPSSSSGPSNSSAGNVSRSEATDRLRILARSTLLRATAGDHRDSPRPDQMIVHSNRRPIDDVFEVSDSPGASPTSPVYGSGPGPSSGSASGILPRVRQSFDGATRFRRGPLARALARNGSPEPFNFS